MEQVTVVNTDSATEQPAPVHSWRQVWFFVKTTCCCAALTLPIASLLFINGDGFDLAEMLTVVVPIFGSFAFLLTMAVSMTYGARCMRSVLWGKDDSDSSAADKNERDAVDALKALPCHVIVAGDAELDASACSECALCLATIAAGDCLRTLPCAQCETGGSKAPRAAHRATLTCAARLLMRAASFTRSVSIDGLCSRRPLASADVPCVSKIRSPAASPCTSQHPATRRRRQRAWSTCKPVLDRARGASSRNAERLGWDWPRGGGHGRNVNSISKVRGNRNPGYFTVRGVTETPFAVAIWRRASFAHVPAAAVSDVARPCRFAIRWVLSRTCRLRAPVLVRSRTA
jgi:hypothetical protein